MLRVWIVETMELVGKVLRMTCLKGKIQRRIKNKPSTQ